MFVCLYWKYITAPRFRLLLFFNSYLFHKCAFIWHEAKGYINTCTDTQIIK